MITNITAAKANSLVKSLCSFSDEEAIAIAPIVEKGLYATECAPIMTAATKNVWDGLWAISDIIAGKAGMSVGMTTIEELKTRDIAPAKMAVKKPAVPELTVFIT